MKLVKLIVVAVVMLLFSAACSTVSNDANEASVVYNGGPLEGVSFDNIEGPSNGRSYYSFRDKAYTYDIDLRNYIITRNPDNGDQAGDDRIVANTLDRATAFWELSAHLRLNTAYLREFHETLGLKYDAWTPNGWRQFFASEIRIPLERQIAEVSREFTANELASGVKGATDTDVDAEDVQNNESVLDIASQFLTDRLSEDLENSWGLPFWCGAGHTYVESIDDPNYNCPPIEVRVTNVDLPNELQSSFNRQVTSEAELVTAQNEANAAVERARGEQRAAQEVTDLTPEFIELKRLEALTACANNSGCVLVFGEGDSNTDVNVNVPAG